MMRLVRNVLLPAVILAAGVAAFAVLMATRKPPERKTIEVSDPAVDVVPVRPAPAEGFGIPVNGTVVPKREVTIAAELEGRVVEKTEKCWAGRAVRRGDILMRLDPRPLDLQRASLDADLDQVAADLAQLERDIENNREMVDLAEQDVELKRREQRRVGTLSAQSVSSASERDAADAQVLTARQTLQQLLNEQRSFGTRRSRLEAQRRRIEAQLEQILYDLARTTIASPVDGRIVEVMVEQDAYARPGEPLVAIVDTSAMEVRCSLRMEDLYWLAGGTDPLADMEDPYSLPHARAEIVRTVAGEPTRWEGVLSRLEGAGIDERTRTLPCRVEVAAPSGLRRGMFVSVTLYAGASRVPLLSIPRVGFRPNEEVWLVRDGRLEIRRVEPVRVLDDAVLVRADGPGAPIVPGDLLIVSPLEAPVPGMEVRVSAEAVEDGAAVALDEPGPVR